jgi:aminoglycoside 3-N-acetyltransferase I
MDPETPATEPAATDSNAAPVASIRRLGPADADVVLAAPWLFDSPPTRAFTDRFLAAPGHHLLMAFDGRGRQVGFISGVETTHPDKGTEMFLYELAVDDAARRTGIGTALTSALRELAREHGCYGMWVLTDADNDAALGTYRKAGASEESTHVMLGWDLDPAR